MSSFPGPLEILMADSSPRKVRIPTLPRLCSPPAVSSPRRPLKSKIPPREGALPCAFETHCGSLASLLVLLAC